MPAIKSRPANSRFGVTGGLPLKSLKGDRQGFRRINNGEAPEMTARPQLSERTPRAKGDTDGPRRPAGGRLHAGCCGACLYPDAGRFRRRGDQDRKPRWRRRYAPLRTCGNRRRERGISQPQSQQARHRARLHQSGGARGCARADRQGGCGGGEFFRRRDEEVRARLCLGRADQSAPDLLLDLGLWPQGIVRACGRASIRSRRPKAASCR